MSFEYYDILEVPREASPSDIKKAYRRLALKYHPDQNDGDKEAEEKFKEISEAYTVLGDPEKRAIYDRTGQPPGASPFGGGSPFSGGSPFGDGVPFGGANDVFIDILNDLFGMRQRQGRARRGSDLKYNLEISLEEAATGVVRDIEIPKIEPCDTCSGSGVKPGSKPKKCQTCNGVGQVRFQQGFFSMARTCGACMGRGEVIDDPCGECDGSGRTVEPETLSVEVPAGVADGQRLRWTGRGEPGFGGGPAGDLYVVVGVAEHSIFKRQGMDVTCTVPITFPQAALGAEVEVPTLDGKVKMKVPGGTQSGKTFRLRKKGFPAVDGGRQGDQLVTVVVETPSRLTPRQEELLREFAEISDDEVQPHRRGFMDRMKDLFS